MLGSLGARLAAVASRAHTRSFFWSWSTFGEGADVVYFSIVHLAILRCPAIEVV